MWVEGDQKNMGKISDANVRLMVSINAEILLDYLD
jgi:hypothetical protein